MASKVEDIIKTLTLEEKASLCSGEDCWFTKAIPEKGVPSIRMCDGPNGLRFQSDADDHMGVHASIPTVCFPTGSAMASSFDRSLMEAVGNAIGEESRSLGVSLVLGPAINIKRTPLCGRNFEYLSEDPYLTGEISGAEIRGIQKMGVGACVKHFACNNQETWRMKINVDVDERTMRELYLAGFERAVKQAQPCALMASYNRVNGFRATENRHLLTDILREEWGFEGFVVSDWGASDRRCDSIQAGMDMEMPGCDGITDKQIVQAVKDGKLDEETIDQTCRRILSQILKIAKPADENGFNKERHHELAVRAAEECAVLLKNEEGILPLKKGAHIVFVGKFAEHPRFQGGGSASVTPFRETSALESASAVGGIFYSPGFTEKEDRRDLKMEEEALAAVTDAETVVIFAGLPETFESEAYDRPHMKLPDCQNKLIERVCEVHKNSIVVLYSGSPVEMPWKDSVKAILQMHTGGQGVGEATVRLLFGDKNPSGKLAETYPLRLEDSPAYLFYPGDGENVKYSEGIFVGYRYYDKRNLRVLFPFGHGLSYTSFQYGELKVLEQIEDGGTLILGIDITNSGTCIGKEIVQLYIGPKNIDQVSFEVNHESMIQITEQPACVERAVRELKGFEKIELRPGETKTVNFYLNERDFSYYSVLNDRWECRSGEYTVSAGASSRDIRSSAVINIKTQERVTKSPFVMESLMSEIAENSELWEKTLSYLSGVNRKLNEIIHGKDGTSLYLKEELKELPVYGVRGLYAVEQEYLDELLDCLNKKWR